MTLTKDRIIEIMRSKAHVSNHDSKELVESMIEAIKGRLEQGEEVKISGFGKWVVREKRSRPGRNPHTGEKIQITARKVVTFHPSEKLRDMVNNAKLDDSKLVHVGSEHDEDEDVPA